MKKILVLAVIGLIAGVGGGTGIAVVMRGSAPADSIMHDSTTATHESTTIVAAHDTSDKHSSSVPQADSGQHSAASEPQPAKHAATVPDTSHGDTTKPIDQGAPAAESDSAQRSQVRRIGRIFAAMAPRDAAKVLQQLEDADVMVIVGSLNEKQAAAILQALPAERAAAISKGSLRPPTTTRGLRP